MGGNGTDGVDGERDLLSQREVSEKGFLEFIVGQRITTRRSAEYNCRTERVCEWEGGVHERR